MARFTPITRSGAWAVLLILAAALLLPSMALACHKGRAHGPHTCGPPDPGPGPATPTMNVAFTDVSTAGLENWIVSAAQRNCQLTSQAPDESTGSYSCDTVPSPSPHFFNPALPDLRPLFHLLDSDVEQTRGKANLLNCIRWDGQGPENEPWGHSELGRAINPDLGFTLTWDSACQAGCSVLITLDFSETAVRFSQNFAQVEGVHLEAIGLVAGASGANPFREDQTVDITEIEITHFAAEKGRIDSICRWQFEPGDITLSTTNTTPSP